MSTRGPSRDGGFTLVELLIVIVILGILATVTVFAVRGITDQGEESACAAEFRNLSTASETHHALSGSYVDEAGLVAAETIVEPSALYDLTVSGDGYAINPAAGSTCTQTVDTDSGAAPPAPPAPPADVANDTALSYHQISAFRYGPNVDPDVVIVGGPTAFADWAKALDTDMVPTTRRVTFIPLANITDQGDFENMVTSSKQTAQTVFVTYSSDAAAMTPDGSQTYATYLANAIDLAPPDHSPDEYYTLTWGGFDLTALLTQLG